MKMTHSDKQQNSVRVTQSAKSRQAQADRFRQRHLDNALKRTLQRYLKPEIQPDVCSAPTPQSNP